MAAALIQMESEGRIKYLNPAEVVSVEYEDTPAGLYISVETVRSECEGISYAPYAAYQRALSPQDVFRMWCGEHGMLVKL